MPSPLGEGMRKYVIARPLAGRGNPEDWSTNDYVITPSFNNGTAALRSQRRIFMLSRSREA